MLQATCRVREPLPVPDFIPPPWPNLGSETLPENPAELYRSLVPEALRQGLEQLTGVAYFGMEDPCTAFRFRGGEKEALERLGYFLGEGLGEGADAAHDNEYVHFLIHSHVYQGAVVGTWD
jgi:hypothetical protein